MADPTLEPPLTPPATPPRISIIILCCNQAQITKLCLATIHEHTTVPYQLILVDNGSQDETPQLLQQFARSGHPGLQELVLIRNETNRGFAAGVNQGLKCCKADYVVLLNNDTLVTSGWLEGLLAVAQREDCQPVGMVGAVSNEVPEPQRVAPAYGNDLRQLNDFARSRRQEYSGQVLEVERVSGFCVLLPRTALDRVGWLDEVFGLGFFEDDDLGVRLRRAGFRLWIALDTYIHHWGSQTVRSLGQSAQQLLQKNWQIFRQKWGEELAGRYHLDTAPAQPLEVSLRQPAPPLPPTAQTSHRLAKVTLCMIVKNEETNLGDCLESVYDLVHEIVVTDTGSTDRTREIAARYGAKIVEFPWVDSFAAARNVSLEQATGDFIFWLDADDRLDETNRAQLRALFARLVPGQRVGYGMKCVCLPDPITRTPTVVDHIRLFPRHPQIRWKYRVHEQILPALRQQNGKVEFCPIAIHHVGYQDPALRRHKLQRDLRLLLMENDEQPDDPFTLFNLGSVYLELQQPQKAVPCLQRSLARSHVSDSIVRKLYTLIASAQLALGQTQQALQTCVEGRRHYPQDAELLYREALLRQRAGDLPTAENLLQQLMRGQESAHFASIDPTLRGARACFLLALVYRQMDRCDLAERLCRQFLEQEPQALTIWLALGETTLQQQRWQEVEQIAQQCQMLAPETLEGEFLTVRGLLGQKQFDQARQRLAAIPSDHPQAVEAHRLLSHSYLQEGKDWLAAEAALRRLLELSPQDAEAEQNLAVLLRTHPSGAGESSA